MGKDVIIALDFPGREETLSFLDRFTGSVVVLGDVQSVETAIGEVVRFLHDQMGFCCAEVTRS